METDCYVPSHLLQKSLFLFVYSDIGGGQYGKHPEQSVRVFQTDDRNLLIGARVSEKAISARSGLVHDQKTVLLSECVFYAEGRLVVHHPFTEKRYLFPETGTHHPGKGLALLQEPEPRRIVASRLYQGVTGFLEQWFPVPLHHNQLIDIPDGLEDTVQMFDALLHSYQIAVGFSQFLRPMDHLSLQSMRPAIKD